MRYLLYAFILIGYIFHLKGEPQNWDGSGDDAFWNEYHTTDGQKELLKRHEAVDLKLSVIIPCYFKHVIQLAPLLHFYEQQSRLPDEVVISLSEADRVDASLLNHLRDELWAFPVTIIASNAKQGPGINRNIACNHAIGDIFVCQDADDIPHPQRVELIYYFFTTYFIDHLMHGYKRIMPEDTIIPFKPYDDLDRVEFACLENFDDVYYARLFVNGNVAIAREILDTVKWPGIRLGEDKEFNSIVYNKFNNCIAIRAILYGYREFLSSTVKIAVKENRLMMNLFSIIPREKRYSVKFIKD